MTIKRNIRAERRRARELANNAAGQLGSWNPLAKAQPSLPGLEPAETVDPMIEYRARVEADIQFIGAAATLLKRLDLQESEKIWEAEDATDTRRSGVFNPGDQVVFTALFLQAVNRSCDIPTVFTTQECSCELCALGNHICTTERLAGYDMFRHLAKQSVRHKGALHVDDVSVWHDPKTQCVSIPRAANTRWLNREDRKALGLEVDS